MEPGHGSSLWTRVAAAASNMTVNVSKAWASNITTYSGERTVSFFWVSHIYTDASRRNAPGAGVAPHACHEGVPPGEGARPVGPPGVAFRRPGARGAPCGNAAPVRRLRRPRPRPRPCPGGCARPAQSGTQGHLRGGSGEACGYACPAYACGRRGGERGAVARYGPAEGATRCEEARCAAAGGGRGAGGLCAAGCGSSTCRDFTSCAAACGPAVAACACWGAAAVLKPGCVFTARQICGGSGVHTYGCDCC
ncbi:hypothetical protein FA95DRAFT_1419202 [Auriscalpium vulgare]|uniref:Uncharacterized protein n=1 Tax=Auriscalpium vulgare TaxID=40419 RepID=A0ACB8RPT0_9AGAM|nr:hypothetical protein FA95DRAFT_1419202 [Auriscalpium vulgare]